MRDPADPKKPINPSKGAFDFSVVAGQVTTFELYPSDLVAPSGNPLATANVFGFDANPPADKWGIDGPRIEVGGTFATFSTYTIEQLTSALSVSLAKPGKNPCGFLSFATGALMNFFEVEQGVSHWHDFKIEPLSPATTYHYLLEFFDSSGKRIAKEGTFTTKMRKIDAQVSSVYITDDGDDYLSGEAEIRAYVYEEKLPPPATPTGTPVELQPYSGDVDTGTNVPGLPIMRHTAGPKAGSFTLGILVKGAEFDIFEEYAASEIKWIPIPTGQNSELVQGDTISIPTTMITDTFSFIATITYSITYE
jgi:hypothetical protein